MFAYCNNCPPNLSDSSGNRPVSEVERFGEVSLPVPERAIVKYNVPLYDQEEYRLCWAFCQIMIQSYPDEVHLTQDQAEASAIELAQARTWFGDWNRGRNPSNLGKCITVQDAFDLYEILRENGPVYAKYVDYSDKWNKDTHLVVVTGVNIPTKTVYTNNPWGKKGAQSFDAFLSGIAWDAPYSYDFRLEGVYPAV